jgi:hypothetical protein
MPRLSAVANASSTKGASTCACERSSLLSRLKNASPLSLSATEHISVDASMFNITAIVIFCFAVFMHY